jgi:hypothetical protein
MLPNFSLTMLNTPSVLSMRCVMLLDCVAGSRHRFDAQLPICFLGRVSQNATRKLGDVVASSVRSSL